MKSKYFLCPQCSCILEKSEKFMFIGRMMDEGAGVALLGSQTRPCPDCGGAIDLKKMAEGQYDPPGSKPNSGTSLISVFGALALFVGAPIAIYVFHVDVATAMISGFVIAGICGLIGGAGQ